MSSTSPHVVMVTNAVAPDKLGGLERYVRELSAALVRVGTTVTVVAKRTDAAQPLVEDGEDGVRLRRYVPPSKSDPLFGVRYPLAVTRGVDRAMRAALADAGARRAIVHGHFPVPMLGLTTRRVPYVYTCHAPVYKEVLSERRGSYFLPAPVQKAAVAGLRAAEQRVIHRAHTLIALSDFVRSEVAELSPLAADRVVRIPGGLDTDWFSPDDAVRGGSSDEVVLFTARRLVERTGVDRLVRAMPHVLAREPRARLVVAGAGPLRAELERDIDRWGLRDRVRLLGRVSEVELRDWYRRADLAVTPTAALEGFGLSTVEALACGTPAFVTPVGANPEVVRGLSPRLIARGAGAGEMARGILELLTSDELPAIRARARDFVHPALGWSAVVDAHAELYDRMPATS